MATTAGRRAARTQAVAPLGQGWVLPYWMERQLDPRSAAFVPGQGLVGDPGGDPSLVANLTARNWTTVGTVASPRRAIVDPRGLVTPWVDGLSLGWSLDWWIGADDRWRFPSREAAVRQGLVASTPVVETAMRIPSGDAVQRVYAISGDEELTVVEVTNRSPVPVAVAFAVRPVNPEGFAVVNDIALDDRTVTIDGLVALYLPRPPSVMAAGTYADGDSAAVLVHGRAGDRLAVPLRCEVGLAQAVFVFPLPHTATVRVMLPLMPQPRHGRPRLPASVPSSEDAARGWQAQTARGMRLELPDGSLAALVAANRRLLLLFHTGRAVRSGWGTAHAIDRAHAADAADAADAAHLLRALDWYGYHDEVAEVLRSYPDVATIAPPLAEHWRLTRNEDLVVRWARRNLRLPRRRYERGSFDYAEAFWWLRGLLDKAALLAAAGDDRAAARARLRAGTMAADLDRSLAMDAERLDSPAIPAGPGRRLDAAAIGALVACWPLGLLGAGSPGVAATAELIRTRWCVDEAFFPALGRAGLGTYLTLQLAFVELEAGDRRALERLLWLTRMASPTACWPGAIHPQLGGGSAGDGHDGRAAADFLALVRNLLVKEAAPVARTLSEAVSSAVSGAGAGVGALELCSMLPADWLGRGLEVLDAPTAHGLLSFAVRWHGERPALLWDLRPSGAGKVRISAPGLDPTWHTELASGEALLAPVSAESFV